MKKKNMLFTKLLFAIVMTVMALGVNKQTVKAEEAYTPQLWWEDEDARQEYINNAEPVKVNGYWTGIFDSDNLRYDWTCNFVHEHNYNDEYIEKANASKGSDGYYYYKCTGESHDYHSSDILTDVNEDIIKDEDRGYFDDAYTGCGDEGKCDAKEVKGDTIYAPEENQVG